MNPKEFTKKEKVKVIYNPNGMHIIEEDVYRLMKKYADQQKTLKAINDVKKEMEIKIEDLKQISELRERVLMLIHNTELNEKIIQEMLSPIEKILTENGVNWTEYNF